MVVLHGARRSLYVIRSYYNNNIVMAVVTLTARRGRGNNMIVYLIYAARITLFAPAKELLRYPIALPVARASPVQAANLMINEARPTIFLPLPALVIGAASRVLQRRRFVSIRPRHSRAHCSCFPRLFSQAD